MRDIDQIVRANKEIDAQFTIGAQKTRIDRLERCLSEVVEHCMAGAYAGEPLPPDHPLVNAKLVLAEQAQQRALTFDPLPAVA